MKRLVTPIKSVSAVSPCVRHATIGEPATSKTRATTGGSLRGNDADAFPGPTRSNFLSIGSSNCLYKLWGRISSPSPPNFGYADNNFLREYECDYGGANRDIDLAGHERDISDHHSLFRLDLSHRDDKSQAAGKVNDSLGKPPRTRPSLPDLVAAVNRKPLMCRWRRHHSG